MPVVDLKIESGRLSLTRVKIKTVIKGNTLAIDVWPVSAPRVLRFTQRVRPRGTGISYRYCYDGLSILVGMQYGKAVEIT
jgi:hypothetical protein